MNTYEQFMVPMGPGGRYSHAFTIGKARTPNNNPRRGQDYDVLSLEGIGNKIANPKVCFKKDADWMLASQYNAFDARDFSVQRKEGRYVYFLFDVDEGNKTLAQIKAAVGAVLPNIYCLLNSTASATPTNKKWHGTIPLTREICYDDFERYQNILFDRLALQGVCCDRVLVRPAQLFFMPSVEAEGDYYEWSWIDGAPYAPGGAGVLCAEAKERYFASQAEKAKLLQATRTRKAPAESIIKWFNNEFDIYDVLEECGYECEDSNAREPEWQSPYQKQSSGGFSTMVRPDGSWTSRSGSDADNGVGQPSPSGGCRGDVFDLFKHYVFKDDQKAALKEAWAIRRKREPICTANVDALLQRMRTGAVQ